MSYDIILDDNMNIKEYSDTKVYGWVEILINDIVIDNGPNLIVKTGKEFIAQKILGSNIMETQVNSNNFFDYKLTHFAIGAGGSNINGTLMGPRTTDEFLYKPISLGNEIYLDDPSNYIDLSGSSNVFKYNNSVKPITTGVIERVGDFNTKIKFTCIIPQGEPSGLQSGENIPINEAGLYITDGISLKLFSHICFGTKTKKLEDEFKIFWYIIC